MKTKLFISAFATLVLTACTKDTPSLDEQIVGKWRVESYEIERYDRITNTSSRTEFAARPNDKFEFLDHKRILVDFDTAALEQWNYKQIDRDELEIDGKPWGITRLNEMEFHLSLGVRDTSLKSRNVVTYKLARP